MPSGPGPDSEAGARRRVACSPDDPPCEGDEHDGEGTPAHHAIARRVDRRVEGGARPDPREAARLERERAVVGLGERYGVQEIAIDRWNSTAVSTALQGEGFTINQFGQGFASMAAPTKELERRVLGGEVNHGKHPVLRWMAANASARTDSADNLKPDKQTSAEKIDGIVALIMGLSRAMVHYKPLQSVYETRDMHFLIL